MKKVLTILLALLVVTGVVFAAPDATPAPADTILTLESSVEGIFNHGFTTTLDETLDATEYETNPTRGILDMTKTGGDAVVLGYYLVKTNVAKNVTVNFTVNPMVNDDEAPTVYVPYILNVSYAENSGSRVFNRANSEAEWATGGSLSIVLLNDDDETSWSDKPVSSSNLDVITPGSYGVGALALALSADFGSENDNANIPEGEYVGTVVASITAN